MNKVLITVKMKISENKYDFFEIEAFSFKGKSSFERCIEAAEILSFGKYNGFEIIEILKVSNIRIVDLENLDMDVLVNRINRNENEDLTR